jgi:hypothetical protein
VNTGVLIATLGVLSLTCWAVVRQVDEMHGQLNAMESDQRAWLKISADPRRVAFDQSSNATIEYGLRVENVGRSVALQARIEVSVIVLANSDNPLVVLEARQAKFC